MSNTLRLHRVLAAKPDKVFRAFTDPDAMARWYPPNGYTCHVDHFEAKAGGKYYMSFTNFHTGKSQGFGGELREFIPSEKISYTDVFDDPAMEGEMLTTVTFKEVSCGTEIHIVQDGLPEALPVEECYKGWQQCLIHLATLVEPDIAD
jgi:uncharacterized protein YndB with AHSA1/START domain